MTAEMVVEGGVSGELLGAEEAVEGSVAGMHSHVSVEAYVACELLATVYAREQLSVAVNLECGRDDEFVSRLALR